MEIEETRVFGLRVRVRERAPEDPVELVALAVRDRERTWSQAVVPHDEQNYFNAYRVVQDSLETAEVEFLYRQSRPGPHEGWNCCRWYKPFLCRHPRGADRFFDFRAFIDERQRVIAFCYTWVFRLRRPPQTLLGKPLPEFFAPELSATVLEALSAAEPGGDTVRLFLKEIPGLPAVWITRHERGGAAIRVRSSYVLPDIAMTLPPRPPRPISFRLGRRNGLRLVWSREEDQAVRWPGSF